MNSSAEICAVCARRVRNRVSRPLEPSCRCDLGKRVTNRYFNGFIDKGNQGVLGGLAVLEKCELERLAKAGTHLEWTEDVLLIAQAAVEQDIQALEVISDHLEESLGVLKRDVEAVVHAKARWVEESWITKIEALLLHTQSVLEKSRSQKGSSIKALEASRTS